MRGATLVVALIAPLIGWGCASTEQNPSNSASGLGLSALESGALVNACEKLARRIRLDAVYCPPLVPAGETSVGLATAEAPNLYVIDAYSTSLAEPGHWAVVSGDSQLVERAFEGRGKMGPQSAKQVPVGPAKGTVYVMPRTAGLHGDHVAVYWSEGSRGTIVSIHGGQNESRAIAMAEALAAETHACGAGSDSGTNDCTLAFPVR